MPQKRQKGGKKWRKAAKNRLSKAHTAELKVLPTTNRPKSTTSKPLNIEHNRPNTKNPPTAEQKRRPKDRQSPKILKNKVLKQTKRNLKTTKRKPPQKHQQNPLFNPLKNR